MSGLYPPGRKIPINGAQMYVEVEGAGPPLVFVHAGVADARMFDAQVAAFRKRYTVIRYDWRGMGRSLHVPGPFDLAADLAGLFDALELARAALVGISFGGRIALDFTLAHPGRVAALALGAPSVSGAPAEPEMERFWEQEEALLEAGDLEAATELNLRLWVDGPQRVLGQADPEVRRRVYAMQMQAFRNPEPDDLEFVDTDAPAIDRLGELDLPVLVLAGALDLPGKLALAERLGREIPNARYRLLPGVAHMLNMERPDQFNAALKEFLDTVGDW